MYVYTYLCIYIQTCIHIYTCTHMCTHLKSTYIIRYIDTCVNIYVSRHTEKQTYLHKHTHIHTYTQIRTYIPMYVYTCECGCERVCVRERESMRACYDTFACIVLINLPNEYMIFLTTFVLSPFFSSQSARIPPPEIIAQKTMYGMAENNPFYAKTSLRWLLAPNIIVTLSIIARWLIQWSQSVSCQYNCVQVEAKRH